MYCPNADCPDFISSGTHAEYVPGIAACPVCGAQLVASLPGHEPAADAPRTRPSQQSEPQAVFETSDPTEAEIIKTILSAADIPFVIQGHEQFHAFRAGHAAFRFNPHAGRLVFLVPTDRMDEARALLTEVEPHEDDASPGVPGAES